MMTKSMPRVSRPGASRGKQVIRNVLLIRNNSSEDLAEAVHMLLYYDNEAYRFAR